MRIRIVFRSIFVLFLMLMVPLFAQAAECGHSYENGVCTQCGVVGTSCVVLTEDTYANWSLEQDLYLDMNGCDLNGVIRTNGYRVYGMDCATDDYDCSVMGSFSCEDEDGTTIVPESFVKTDAAITGSVRRYMTIVVDGCYTFHRFYLGITHASLKPNTAGFGYKALFCADELVLEQLNKEQTFGYSLRLGNYMPVSAHLPLGAVKPNEAVTLRINNWNIEDHGQTALAACVFLNFKDGTTIYSTEYSTTLRQQVEAVNVSYKSFTAAQLNAVRALIEQHPVMKSWDVSNFYSLSYAFTDVPKVNTAYKFGVVLPPMNNANYYFNGQITGYYLDTDLTEQAAVDVYMEQVSGGYTIYFMNGSTKTYINVRSYSSSTGTVYLSTTSPTVYKLNTQHKYIYTTVGSRSYYLGTYTNNSVTYTTLSASNVSYISDTSKIGVTQFPAWFFELSSSGTDVPGDDIIEDGTGEPCDVHIDENNSGKCDLCSTDVTVVIDLYAINDLHGKLVDADSHPGVDELSTYISNARAEGDNVILLSSGDMWQGAAESNLTKGLIVTDWMNEMDFVSMTIGNHEFDWGEEVIAQNAAFAEFPLLAINIYDADTDKQVEYCQSSVVVEMDGIQVGIIGAVGDCYSSIAADRREGVYFITGSQLTNLVKAEATRLRAQGVDFIVYSLHDGNSSTSSSGHYDASLSNGYVDIVFEGHTHESYVKTDTYGVYHLQGGGDNDGITYASVTCNTANGNSEVTIHQVISGNTYSSLPDHPIIAQLLVKYEEQVSIANKVLGINPSKMNSSAILRTVADLYCQAGVEKWGDEYDIVLGGGYLNCRSPYNLSAGEVTYGMLMSLLPFDNRLVLCSISGQNLLNRFINNSSSDYYIAYSEYGSSISGNISPNKTYYVIVDSYSAYYAPNKLTVVDFYDEDVYARDLFAAYLEEKLN